MSILLDIIDEIHRVAGEHPRGAEMAVYVDQDCHKVLAKELGCAVPQHLHHIEDGEIPIFCVDGDEHPPFRVVAL